MSALVYRSPLGGARRFAPWVVALGASSGVYVIRSAATRQVLYVGESHTGRLRKTLLRHFQAWSDDKVRRHFVIRPESVEVAVRLCPPSAAPGAQDRLIQRLQPKHNRNGFEPGPF